MMKFVDVSGKTEEAAIEKALKELHMDRDEVSIEVLERAKSGFLGFGSVPARVRVSYDDGMPESVQESPKDEREHITLEETQEEEEFLPEVLHHRVQEPFQSVKKEIRLKDGSDIAVEKESSFSRSGRDSVTSQKRIFPNEECTDEISARIRAYVVGLLDHMGCEAKVGVFRSEERYLVRLSGENVGALIGRHGETLDAIQQLTGYTINREEGQQRVRIQFDAEGYRERREQSLMHLAQKTAERVMKYRRNITMDPMNAYERHVVHTVLQETPRIVTYSVGSEPNRRVIVAYDRNKK